MITRRPGKPWTESESILVDELKKAGYEVRCNRRVFYYYPDIQIVGTNILIEVDGGYHTSFRQRLKDSRRDSYLKRKGYVVLRFPNDMVVQNPNAVLASINLALNVSA